MEHWEIGQLQKKWDSLIEQYISTLQLTTTQKKRIQNAAEAFFENIRNANQKGNLIGIELLFFLNLKKFEKT